LDPWKGGNARSTLRDRRGPSRWVRGDEAVS
jgi:hypothetical protein